MKNKKRKLNKIKTMETIEEMKKAKTKLEKNILYLLEDFQDKYSEFDISIEVLNNKIETKCGGLIRQTSLQLELTTK